MNMKKPPPDFSCGGYSILKLKQVALPDFRRQWRGAAAFNKADWGRVSDSSRFGTFARPCPRRSRRANVGDGLAKCANTVELCH